MQQAAATAETGVTRRHGAPPLDPLLLWRAWIDGWCGFARGVLGLQIELLQHIAEGAGAPPGPQPLDSVGTVVNVAERRRQGWRPASSNSDLTARPRRERAP
jgi:hypothetical protein